MTVHLMETLNDIGTNMIFTLSEILTHSTHDGFEKFCKDFGYSTWVVSEGGGHLQQSLTIDQCQKYGITLLTV